MSNLTNKPVPFRTLSRDVLLMEKYHQTTYTRDKEGHLVVHEPAVSFPKVYDSIVSGYWQPLPGPAQSRKNDFSKLLNHDFSQLYLVGDYPYFEPVMVNFITQYVDGVAGYGFEIPESVALDKATSIIWIPQVTVAG
ncbi:hypothetical protein [Limosilactobacillus fastidiosus]|uniref:Uncharacterized protein n=1 Tax=Limosilactobacillus fastidiosus TaxID=2759855 RepID=A0A7W3TY27_9LACO|nr:hypothetical protein [Limosilactobacillus fastidiosus]MBB1063181.1 hypothetical protein [Limosilactobacillus fastidiosus]MBB1085403.1 hypothetical protein [Limosilactobacillus fastidiosus]MCD7083705.1 hypothetical protein [Limosilactobacillus fastidiosus]MCD7085385.1 hypothetical protein [Limosilactobacillus fastidiosus]MCD7114850.1 hypothetical protein [Limosilactobacillus fastidiosus]